MKVATPTALAPSKPMKTYKALILILFIGASSIASFSQTTPRHKRITSKSDRFDFGVGGTLAVTGAPVGSIRIEGWKNREVEITAEIEIQANSEADLSKLSEVTTFVLQESVGRIEITSIGI